MKKLIFACIALVMSGSIFAQPIHDRAVIPVAVTINQVLRLNITKGGNMEFVINTIEDFKEGVANSVYYDTHFAVASSKDFDVYLYAEDATLVGTDNSSQSLALNNIGWTMTDDGGTHANGTEHTYIQGGATANGLTGAVAAASKIVANKADNSGDALDNKFKISWQCGTTIVTGTTPMNAASLLDQSIAPDRYVSNVFLTVVAL